jgi:membrane protein implicated in regulation of membrane protease activity
LLPNNNQQKQQYLVYCAPVTFLGNGGFLFLRTDQNNKKEDGMTDWMVWFGLAGVLVVLEMFTGTFYLLMVGAGSAAGGIAAVAGAGGATQLAIAAIVGIIATYALRRSKWGKISAGDASRNPNINLDIGQTLTVDAWNGDEQDTRTARVMYRGAMWDVQLEYGARACPGSFVIREVRGSRLIVANSGSDTQ